MLRPLKEVPVSTDAWGGLMGAYEKHQHRDQRAGRLMHETDLEFGAQYRQARATEVFKILQLHRTLLQRRDSLFTI